MRPVPGAPQGHQLEIRYALECAPTNVKDFERFRNNEGRRS